MRSWIRFALVGLVVLVAGAVPTVRDLSAEASPQATFVKTVMGTDFHSLDYRFAAQFIPNGAGGVYAHLIPGSQGTIPDMVFLEANVDLPGGARVTGVDTFFRECLEGIPDGSHYFGSYDPRSPSFEYHLTPQEPPFWHTTCQFQRLVRTLSPGLRVSTARRYVVGVEVSSDGFRTGGDPVDNPILTIAGARVRYTCPEGCVP